MSGRMTDFGGRLREAREQRGISLRQIAANTKISVAALQALERNDVSKLPGGIFSRSFVRSYASEVGLDPDQTVTEFLERFQGEQAAAPAARVVTEAENVQFTERRAAGMAVQAVIIVAVLGGVFALFAFRGKDQPSPAAASIPPPAPRAEVATTPPASTAQPAAPAVDDVLRATGPMRLEVHPTGPCWVKVSADGQDLFAKLMQAGQRETFTVQKSATISIGDAGAFAFSIDGHAGRPLGSSGQVTTARITRDTLADFLR
jgi:cytoskeletal protein RodZ